MNRANFRVVASDSGKRVATFASMAEVQSGKRVRAKVFGGPGVAYSGNYFVCNHCGSLSQKALVEVPKTAFCTHRCQVAWLYANAPADQLDALLEQCATACGQKSGMVVPAPKPDDLVQFGGTLTRAQWMPDVDMWDELTVQYGKEKHELKQKKPRAKPGASKEASITFEVGVYSIAASKTPPKKLESAEDEVKAQRKRNAFVSKNSNYVIQHFDGTKYSVTSCGATEPDPAHLNNVASQLVGFNVYGPAYAVFTTKVALKV